MCILCCCLTLSQALGSGVLRGFQYILCCCLTWALHAGALIKNTFQYILCCCLTAQFLKIAGDKPGFNTSYVVV